MGYEKRDIMGTNITKLGLLKEYFGHDSFRKGQEGVIDAILSGRDVMGIMPTGAGKSVCYQIPALMSEGIAIVVSPLISLMKDQVNSLIQSGVSAAYLNSSLTQQQYDTAIQYASRGAYKLIYVAPERLCTPSFLNLASKVRLSLIAVDEAHCVSQWGQDFRPSYMRIPEFLTRLGRRPPVAAFTATATAAVRDDIIRMLGLREPYSVTTGFDRENLKFSVAAPKDKLSETLEVIRRNRGRSGIIYCSTRKKVEELCEKLKQKGISCTRYHAGLPDEERRSNQDDFIYDRVPLIVATNAFGMGIDKSNVGFVLHYNMPKNIESYYQEAGRAGRDGEKAECVLLYSPQDVRTNTFLIENSSDNADIDEETAAMLRSRDMERLRQMTFYSTTRACLREFILNYFGEHTDNYCGNCSNCLAAFEERDITVDAQKILSCIYRLAQRNTAVGASTLADILKGSRAEKIRSRSYDTLSTYGIMKDTPAQRIRSMIVHLEHLGYIIQTGGEYSVLKLTAASRKVLTGGEKVRMKLPKEEKKARIRTVSDGIYAFDHGLFDRLKELRAALAAEARLPAYIIFTDKALRDICVKLPQTQEELLDCSGIGRSKQERYGKRIISTVKEYLEDQGGERASLSEQRAKMQIASGDAMLFKLIRFNKAKLRPAEGELTPEMLCERMLECLGISADRKKLRSALDKWLIRNGYMTRGSDTKEPGLTILSEEAGLRNAERLSASGKYYTQTVISPEGQSFIFENIDEIFSWPQPE